MEKADGLKHNRHFYSYTCIFLFALLIISFLSSLTLGKLLSFHLGFNASFVIAILVNALVFGGGFLLCIRAEKWNKFYNTFRHDDDLILEDMTDKHKTTYYNIRYRTRYHFCKGRLYKKENIIDD